MRILWHSNHPLVATGYGNQTSLFAPRLRDLGHDVAVSAFYGQAGWVCQWEGMTVLPGGYHPFGNDVLIPHAERHFGGPLNTGLILTLVDVWVLDAAALSRGNVACWVPVDHQPVPPRVVEFLETSGAVPVAMSRFGEAQLGTAGLDPLYVPHGVDTTVYHPTDQGEARDRLGVPRDRFTVGMVAANKGQVPPRKGFAQALTAFKTFHESHPDAVLHLHTEPLGINEGVHLPQLINGLGLAESVRFSNPYMYQCGFPADLMAALYSSFDVLLNPAFGEGFGIPVVEAQACGTPVIVGDWTAMPELCGAGWLVEGDPYWTPQGSFMRIPHVGSIADALESAYREAGDLREWAREFAVGYDADRVLAEHWVPALAEVERRLFTTPPDVPALVELPLPVAA